MRKEYIKPETTIYTININKSILLIVSDSSEVQNPTNLVTDTDQSIDEDSWESGEYSRDNNGGNVWDNGW